MTAFSVGSFASSGAANLGGQSFTPNVPGPDGSGSPGSATTVLLRKITMGYGSSDTTGRSHNCYVYSVPLNSQDEVGQPQNCVGSTDMFTDGSDFGANTYTRAFGFSGNNLDPTKPYYIYFDTAQYVRYKSPSPYSGGTAWDEDFDDVPYDTQFQVQMST